MENHLRPARSKVPNSVRRHNQTYCISQHKRIPLRKSRPLHRLKHQKWRPNRRRLCNRIQDHQRHRPFHRRVSQLTIHPSVQNARHSHGGVGGAKGEPEGGFGDIPHDQDDQPNDIPGVRECDGPGWAEEEIGCETDEEGVEDAQAR